jgi:hypothetical protein
MGANGGMMGKKMPWFRMYSEALNDRKFKRICRTTGQSMTSVIGFWTILLIMANDSPQRGTLLFSDDVIITDDDILAETGLQDATFHLLIQTFKNLGLISQDVAGAYFISSWDKRQYQSDNVTERVRKHREKKKELEKQNETFLKRFRNAPETEADTETETEEEGALPLPATFKPKTDNTGGSFQPPDFRTMGIKQAYELPAISQYRRVTGRDPGLPELSEIYARLNGTGMSDEHLTRFWVVWTTRKTKSGKPYRRDNPAWLDWALSDSIPAETKREPKSRSAKYSEVYE